MMICENENCGREHDGSYGSGRFCSRSCANSRARSEEDKKKISEGIKKAYAEGRAKRPNITQDQIDARVAAQRKKAIDELMAADYSSLRFERLRKRVILEQDNKCNRCGLDEWLDEPLMLELEHKDGNNQNNDRDNIECLCPNCHSLTPTWRGRNKSKVRTVPVSEEQMVRAYARTGNIRQALLELDLAAKGANYGRMKKALTSWGIEY
jgi:hypothetical protein